MINAKDEFIDHIQDRNILCVSIQYGDPYYRDYINLFLPCGYSDSLFESFLDSLNFNYNDGFGSQELFGCIWYKDGTWSVREVDGVLEWWSYRYVPKIPKELL
jgi:hypothetical protein